EQRFDETRVGAFKAYVDGTWTHSFERSESCSPGSVSTRRGAGACGADGQRLFEKVGEFRYPEWLVNTGVSWFKNDWSASVWANYVDGYYDDDEQSNVPAGRQVGSWTTLNLSVNWDFSDRQSLGLNVRNLTDRDPPRALGSASNLDDYSHNSLGRFITFNYIYRL
ncbi:MAG: TonB-dependent receptor, partial [Arenimonas sp.]|nr:TonB-dependent receptor [Arenimonas sp.]